MRLIRTSPPFELGEFFENQILNLEYAILSHRWEEEELSFQEMIAPTEQIRQKKGYQKVKHFCERARADGFEYVWVDTCCINKESSAELSESINSMFRWYLNATKCYAYMLDVSMIETDCLDQLLTSVWFTRGWTLQELVAPQEMVFLANDWSEIGSRRELASRIEQITNIDTALLLGKTKLYNYCISKRMSWAATRETTRTEDRAYCLMGIFNVNMPLLYGEGENAFIRLQEEIMKDSNDETLFAWERNGISEEKPCGLLAPSPDCFAESGDIVPYPLSENGLPFGSTNRGIRMQSPLVPPVSSTTTLILQCVGSSKLVGVGIMTSPSSPDYVRITSNLLRDIPYSVLLGAVLDTAYIPKSLFLASTNNSALQAQASDSEANSSSQIADHLLNRRIQPRGHCKNLVLCFDDTTSPYTADGNASNVAKLHRMLDRSEGNQVAFYQTWGRGTTLESVTKDAYRFIMEYYQREDEISLVGFSRGCHAAQTLDEFMDHFGILFSSHEKMIDEAWSTFLTFKSQEGRAKQYAHLKLQYFRESFCRPRRRISFVGLFDAVDPDAQNNRHSTSYMVFSSQFVCHALAIDERQASLRPTLAKKYTKYTSYSQYFEQVWFPGAHEVRFDSL
ncbi:hypothetical protein VI817_004602 [Penicillium citrinum]|nr:hypothetical protein VI817_004602 [Penicillium citrinum]